MSTPYPRGWETDVVMADGERLHVRPITPLDGRLLRRFHARLSDQSIYLRYFGAKPQLSDDDVAHLTTVDYDDRVAFIALLDGEIIGVARYERLSDARAEVAFLVRDDMQRRGVGTLLLERLAAAALERGIGSFVAEVLPVNHRMLDMFRESGFEVHVTRSEDVMEVSFDIDPRSRRFHGE